jgi:hypothetical protein
MNPGEAEIRLNAALRRLKELRQQRTSRMARLQAVADAIKVADARYPGWLMRILGRPVNDD